MVNGNGETGNKVTGEHQLLELDEAAAYLRVSRNTLNNWKSMRKITFHKVGRRALFDLADLVRFVEAGRVEARV